MPSAKDVINSIKPNLTKAPQGQTQKGSAGYDNVRDDIEKTKSLREGSIQKVPVNTDDITNKAYVDTKADGVDPDHTHSKLVASDGTPDNSIQVSATGQIDMNPEGESDVTIGKDSDGVGDNPKFFISGWDSGSSSKKSGTIQIGNTGGMQFDANSGEGHGWSIGGTDVMRTTTGIIQIVDNTNLVIGSSTGDDSKFAWSTTGNDHLTLMLKLNSSNYSGYFTIAENGTRASANRAPSAVTTHPTLRIYGEGDASADDYFDFYQDLTDANIEVGSGNLNIKAPQVFVGASTGLPYGEFHGIDIAWSQVAVQNTWYLVSDATLDATSLNMMTHDGNGQLTALKEGVFKFDVALSVDATAANKDAQFGLSINGAAPTVYHHIDFVTANKEHEGSLTRLLDLAANDTVEVAIRTTIAAGATLEVNHLSLTCVQIGGT